jgi:hypothetical protein
MTPTLSVLAVHERLIWEEEIADAERFVGIEGGVASTGVSLNLNQFTSAYC